LGRNRNEQLLEPSNEKSVRPASGAHDVKAKILLPLSEQLFSIDRIGEYAMIVSAMV
jgi:hypothetical protein